MRVGQRVEPEDVVARAFLTRTPHVLNVARALAISPTHIDRAMRREVGNKVTQNEVLARASRLGGRVCLAPVSGEIAAVDTETGYVTIIPDREPFELQATVRGLVMEVLPYEGVRIETPGAQVYGAFGFGRERSGVLRLLVTDPSAPIVPEMIDARSAYAILIGGSSVSAAALRRAVQEQVRGVIVGGIDERELRTFLGQEGLECWRTDTGSWEISGFQGTQQELTLVVTEGFGPHAMSAPVFELLATHDRQEALIAGVTRLRAPQVRPRVVIPLSTRSGGVQIEAPRAVLRPGSVVRLLDEAHLGQIGRVRALSQAPRRLTSRVRTQAVDVVLEDGSSLLLPQTAVEALS
ncbi:MAG TPA: hypothetical protein VFS21_32380 [Roseiflexaceae bacterium]|nr:hypothetical protein [Roseiflexaceae bacterium]